MSGQPGALLQGPHPQHTVVDDGRVAVVDDRVAAGDRQTTSDISLNIDRGLIRERLRALVHAAPETGSDQNASEQCIHGSTYELLAFRL